MLSAELVYETDQVHQSALFASSPTALERFRLNSAVEIVGMQDQDGLRRAGGFRRSDRGCGPRRRRPWLRRIRGTGSQCAGREGHASRKQGRGQQQKGKSPYESVHHGFFSHKTSNGNSPGFGNAQSRKSWLQLSVSSEGG